MVACDGERVVLRGRQMFEKFLIVVAVACLVLGTIRVISPQTIGGPRNTANPAKDWGFFLLCISLGAAFVSVRDFRLGWSFDGSTRTVTRVRGFLTRRWDASAFQGVSVRVGHEGPDEILALVLDKLDDPEAVLNAPSDRRGLAVPAAALRIADVLDWPIARTGSVVQGGPEVRAALDAAGPAPMDELVARGDGRDILINCPACKQAHVPAVSYDHHEQYHGLTRTTTWVKCLACGMHLYSKVTPGELIGRSPEELEGVVGVHRSLIGRVTAILAIVLCLFPWVGMGISLLATLITWRIRGWPRTLSRVALAISVVPTVAATILVNSPSGK